MARCGRLLARLDLAAGDPTTARSRATAAVATFRNGDYLTELAATLPVLADSARAAGDLDASTGHVAAALSITGSRGLLPFQAEALTVRAPDLRRPGHRGRREHLAWGRDAAEAAHRIATRRRLAWQELDAWTPAPTSTRPRASTTAGPGRPLLCRCG